MRQRYLNARLQGFGTTIFAEMTSLAVATGAVNLGQGFPDTDGPIEVRDAAIEAIRNGYNQYPPALGLPALRQAIAEHQQRFYGLTFDPDTEVLVTAGGTEAIAASLLALCETGDEVIAFEPYYDSYAACIAMSGAIRRPITLRPPTFAPDLDAVRDAINPRTRLLLLNSPHNPTGHVLTREELTELARFAVEHDLLVVSDEVYEHLTFGVEHIPIASLPGMRERTVTIGSGGKSFSMTGWKVGWVTACPELVTAVRTAKQFLTYVSAGPFQPAIAVGLRLPDSYFLELADDLQVQARPALRRPGRGRVRRLRAEGHLLRPDRHPAARRDRRVGVLPVAARAVRPRRHPVLGLLRRQGGRPQPGALRVLQAPRGARRRGRQAEGPLPADRWIRSAGWGPGQGRAPARGERRAMTEVRAEITANVWQVRTEVGAAVAWTTSWSSSSP